MATPIINRASISLPDGFRFGQVHPQLATLAITPTPSLGPLAAFAGTWKGSGFNTIFRPQSSATPTPLPIPAPGDNVLELNLTAETLTFSPPLGSVPNRGMVQGDIFLNGVPYLQAINDITTGNAVGIHVEPGIWLAVPPTTNPKVGPTVARLASIPHGTTIEAQGTSRVINGPPAIPAAPITPAPASGGGPIHFPSQVATAHGTARIPQDLTSFIANGSITQAMLDDPNTLLRNHIASQAIVSTTEIVVSSKIPVPHTPPVPPPAEPTVGGGVDNIAFLAGSPGAPNAQVSLITSTFWIETVEHTLNIPIVTPGHPPLLLHGEEKFAGQLTPSFLINPPHPITAPRTIKFHTTQIQYSQTVNLVFNTLSWPHVSVATLVPADPISVPAGAWT